jgi:putative transposase
VRGYATISEGENSITLETYIIWPEPQRGNGGARTFFSEQDYALCRDLLAESCAVAGVAVGALVPGAWCLMPNHVHLILVPSGADGLRRALASVHQRYAGVIHARWRRAGHFWQGRFGAVAMDEERFVARGFGRPQGAPRTIGRCAA